MKFSKTFDNTVRAIEQVQFHEEWNNGTGYFDNVVNDEAITSLSPGLYGFHTGEVNDRHGIIVKNTHGEMYVIHERYTNYGIANSDYNQVYVSTSGTNKAEIYHKVAENILDRIPADDLYSVLVGTSSKELCEKFGS